uniref:Uncharacterized protein n=1 Tax=Arundo donax TaxID=35708 RepID=A0A0A9GI49_ARUDO
MEKEELSTGSMPSLHGSNSCQNFNETAS